MLLLNVFGNAQCLSRYITHCIVAVSVVSFSVCLMVTKTEISAALWWACVVRKGHCYYYIAEYITPVMRRKHEKQ